MESNPTEQDQLGINIWFEKAIVDLYQWLKFFETEEIYGNVSITFNIQKGRIVTYEVNDKIMKRLTKPIALVDGK